VADGHKGSVVSGPSAMSIASGRGASTLPALPSPSIPEKLRAIALARFDLVKAWKEHRALYGSPKSLLKADRDFEKAYNTGRLLPDVFKVVGSVDIRSIKRWGQALNGTDDWTRLVPAWSCERREPSLTDDEKQIFQDCLLQPNRLKIGEATKITKQVLAKRGALPPSSDRNFRRWAEWFKTNNGPIWTLMRDGEKALRETQIFSIPRDTSRIAVGDIIVADGHRLNFQVMNPFTGKPCRATLLGYKDWKSGNLAGFEIMVEENTQCIASALRQTIIHLRKAPKVAYQDNGKAFRAKFFTSTENLQEVGISGLFGRLGITPVFAAPYNAKAKPIERFWKEFTGKFERLLPSFTGSSVEDKPAWMLRNEKFHRQAHNGYVPTIEETVDMVNAWIRDYWEKQPCPHAKGKTIGAVFHEGQGPGVDLAALDDLMLAVEVKKIGPNGIRFLKADYYDDQLFGLRERVVIRYSLSDLTSVRVYDLDGHFICAANRFNPVHPMAAQLGDAKDLAEVKYLQKKQRNLHKAVVKAAREMISARKDEALPWNDVIAVLPKTPDSPEAAAPQPVPLERHIPVEALKKESPAPEGVTGQPDRPEYWPLDGGITRYRWHEEHGYTEEDRAWFDNEFKLSSAYRMLVIEPEKDRLRYERERAESEEKTCDSRATGHGHITRTGGL